MSLLSVRLTKDAFLTCTAHALSNEEEEIMGLLIGAIQKTPEGEAHAQVFGVSMLMRSDKRADRVEVSPLQMLHGQRVAEDMSRSAGKDLRVIGWYHSHPHITIHPSHVDIATQASYQQLELGFVGLIVSVFDQDPVTKQGSIKLIAFQSRPGRTPQRIPATAMPPSSPLRATHVPLAHVSQDVPGQHYFMRMIELQRILIQEERDAFIAAAGDKNTWAECVTH
eukprot:c1114_g1_i1.p1 GENE.c1114_g1_i1~~c1114_g1_i1.p1  ORF type:complete len:224 (+),score=56.03 c1114_g1_i1:54-725(+)